MAFKTQNIGAEISIQGIKLAKANAAGNIDGPWIPKNDLLGVAGLFNSAKAWGNVQNVTGSPTAVTLALKIRDATDGSGSGAADFKPDGTNTAQSVIGINESTLANLPSDVAELNVNIANARAFVSIRAALGFTAGTSPAGDVMTGWALGGSTNLPTATQNA